MTLADLYQGERIDDGEGASMIGNRKRGSWQDYLCLGLSLIVCVSIAVILSSNVRMFLANESVIGWASTLGTFTAAGVALWLADRERRYREDTLSVEGRVVREMIRPEVRMFLDTLVQSGHWFLQISRFRPSEDSEATRQLGALSDALKLDITYSERPNFQVLRGDEADAAARLLGVLPVLKELFRRYSVHAHNPAFIVFNREDLSFVRSAASDAALLLALSEDAPEIQSIRYTTSFPENSWWSIE